MTFAQTAQQEAMKREERLTTLLEDAIGVHAQHGNAEPVHSDNQTVSDSSDSSDYYRMLLLPYTSTQIFEGVRRMAS